MTSRTFVMVSLCVAFFAPGSSFALDNSAYFDGAADYIDFGQLDPGPDFTFEAWVQFDTVTSWNTVVEVVEHGVGINSFYLGYNQGSWEIELNDSTQWEGDTCNSAQAACFSSAVSPLTPHHVAVSRDSNDLLFYINGNLIMTWPSPPVPTFGAQSWIVGADTDNGTSFTSDPLDGYLGEVRVWDHARTQSELISTMHFGLTGQEAGLYALWSLDEDPSSATASDATGNGWTGTLMGDAVFTGSPFFVNTSTGGDIPSFDFDEDGYTPTGGDCDDNDLSILPGGTEACDEVDSNCDGDLVDGFANVDGDALPDCVDPDNDNDGDPDISDCEPLNPAIFTGAIELCDGLDSNCDGELVDGFSNLDGDAEPDCVDLDDDGDGTDDLSDNCPLVANAAQIDTDSDGFGDDCDSDDDGDGSDDTQDCAPLDATVAPGSTELCDSIDSDCDGDVVDEFLDSDGDGEPDCVDLDDDADLFPDVVDCAPLNDLIHPGAVEQCDAIDSNCNGSLVDGFDDTDGDDEPDCTDLDDDDDGLSDLDELSVGSDPTNADSDGDGLSDGLEWGADSSAPQDSDGDSLPDLLDDDDDDDGLLTAEEGSNDVDLDGVPNHLDTDSDGDGFADGYEGSGDADGDGLANFEDTDSDGNGTSDTEDGDGDMDADSIPDFLDVDDGDGPGADADGDGLTNGEEGALGTDPQDPDSDGDGLSDGEEIPNPNIPADTDGDDIIDALDSDDDGDGIATSAERAVDVDGDGAADPDVDGDGVANHLDEDSDDDGLSDAEEGDGDFDGDQVPDYVDVDADGDGISDEVEGSSDSDGDGAIDAYDLDSDGDGFTDSEEGDGDLDGDGILNFRDLDVDGDGASDADEGDGDLDEDGTPNWLDPDDSDGPSADADSDGLTNAEEAALGTNAYLADSDGDGLDDGVEVLDLGTDPLSVDTDGDGMDDGIEVGVGADPLDEDTDGDGILDGPDGLGDEDEDGIINVLDPFESAPGDDDDSAAGDDDDSAAGDDDDSAAGDGGGLVVGDDPLTPQCGCTQGGAVKERSDALVLALALLGLYRRRSRRRAA
jgi:large repetitive protein